MTYRIKKIIDWLDEHPLIDLEKLKISSEVEFEEFEELNDDELEGIEAILYNYGFK